MKKTEILDELLEQGNGYLLTSNVLKNGISKTYLADYVKKKHLERVAQGVYATKDTWPDELFLISVRNKSLCFSHETALYLHGMMEREPSMINMSVKQGYNASHLKGPKRRIYWVKAELYELGRTEIETGYGNLVAVYDLERTICDIIKVKNQIDIQVFQTALKEYMQAKDRKLTTLLSYAGAMGIEKQVRNYVEVMV